MAMYALVIWELFSYRTLGTATAGAIGKSIGLVAPSANATIRAKGLTPSDLTASLLINTNAAAPSFKVDAFPAVTVPPSLFATKQEED